MRRAFSIVARLLLMTVVALLLVPVIVPPFLDRVYYRGSPSDHFDGERFFNPEGQFGTGGSRSGWPLERLFRFATRDDRQDWPASIPVTPTKPPARVDGEALRVTWVGHATVLVQTQGLNILTDPIWAERTGPFARGPQRRRAPGVRLADLPRIDAIVVSHNHYDHLDLPTLKALWDRDRPRIVTGLGNETILKGEGIPATTRDWGGVVPLKPGVGIVVERVHHWGSRWFVDRDRALWSGFTILLPGGNIFFAGDTGFGDGEWVREAARRGPIRLAILPIGAYKPREMMSGNHIGPAEAAKVFDMLGAARGLAIHWGTFPLSSERINEPAEVLPQELDRLRIARDRFRTTAPGVGWNVPAIGR